MALTDSLPPVVEPSDDDLVARARGGDGSALDLLARRHRRAAFLLAFHILRNREDAMDATQDALVRFLTALPRFRPGSPVKPWLMTIVRNRCRDLMRRQRVRRADSLDADEEGWRMEPVDPALSPEERAGRSELQRQVWAALAELPENHREILVLRDYHDLAYTEIAAVLDVPVGTVMSRLHRARKALAAILGPLLREESA